MSANVNTKSFTTTVATRLPVEQAAALAARAKAADRPVSAEIRRAVRKYLEEPVR